MSENVACDIDSHGVCISGLHSYAEGPHRYRIDALTFTAKPSIYISAGSTARLERSVVEEQKVSGLPGPTVCLGAFRLQTLPRNSKTLAQIIHILCLKNRSLDTRGLGIAQKEPRRQCCQQNSISSPCCLLETAQKLMPHGQGRSENVCFLDMAGNIFC